MSTQGYKLDRETLLILKQHKIATVVISFSGGNDEGGPDNVTFKNAAGDEVSLDKSIEAQLLGSHGYIDQGVRLCHPIEDKFGSWAGEFEAHGELTWDVQANSCSMQGEESTYQSTDFGNW